MASGAIQTTNRIAVHAQASHLALRDQAIRAIILSMLKRTPTVRTHDRSHRFYHGAGDWGDWGSNWLYRYDPFLGMKRLRIIDITNSVEV